MKYSARLTAALGIIAMAASCRNAEPPAPYGPVPTAQQLEWQKMEMNMFCHFGPNTFTEAEWGSGQEDADVFNPSGLDCRQWTSIARAAGMKGIIITAKHHDGFCLWPNPVSSHTVAQSSWRDGKGDVLEELSRACRESGVEFGVYISPWDRNDPAYGTSRYNEIYCRTLESALGNYGPVFEQWFDGACGEGPTGKVQEYDWPLFHKTVGTLQPDAVMFSDIGPGCRWVGNEDGYAGETCWSTLDIAGFQPGAGAPPRDTLNCGNVHGEAWVPAEADVSIRPGWFYKDSENDRIKTLEELLGIYYASVGRNAVLLLNVPPDRTGRIYRADSLRLMEFRKATLRMTPLLNQVPCVAGSSGQGISLTGTTTRTGAPRTASRQPLSPYSLTGRRPSTVSCSRNISLSARESPDSMLRYGRQTAPGNKSHPPRP